MAVVVDSTNTRIPRSPQKFDKRNGTNHTESGMDINKGLPGSAWTGSARLGVYWNHLAAPPGSQEAWYDFGRNPGEPASQAQDTSKVSVLHESGEDATSSKILHDAVLEKSKKHRARATSDHFLPIYAPKKLKNEFISRSSGSPGNGPRTAARNLSSSRRGSDDGTFEQTPSNYYHSAGQGLL